MKIVSEGPKLDRVWSLHVYTCLSRGLFASFIEKIPNVEMVRRPKLFSRFREDEFMEFTYCGQLYCAGVEAISKNYFEIHPKPVGCKKETSVLRQKMEDASKKSMWSE